VVRNQSEDSPSEEPVSVPLSEGTKLTWEHANKLGKPVLHIYDTRKERILIQDWLRLEIQAVTNFMRSNKIRGPECGWPSGIEGARCLQADADYVACFCGARWKYRLLMS
jgi:hypothetical protein